MAHLEQPFVDLTKEFSMLPAIYDILKSIEKTNDSQEITRKVILREFLLCFEQKKIFIVNDVIIHL